MDYPGKIITKNQVTPTQTSASGNWTLDDAAAAVRNNNWPVAGVPNPISKSLRFNSADSAYLDRTPGVASNRKTWTWSGWVKRSGISGSATYEIFCGDNGATSFTGIRFINDIIYVQDFVSGTKNIWWETTAVFRDPSAWYHIVVKYDTTQASSTNSVLIYVNGVSQALTFTASTGAYVQNYDGIVNSTFSHKIGQKNSSAYFPGYMTEINFIDGQALDPTSFGLTDPQTGQWIPKKYTGTYGTNGFYLNFKDATNTTTLGNDYSGNGNNWTTNNFSVTAGAGNDSLTDVPTPWIAYNTTGDVGGVVRGNYCTLNPLNAASAYTLSNGNLDFTATAADTSTKYLRGTFGVSSGKWYWEVTPSAVGSGPNLSIGIQNITYTSTTGTVNTCQSGNAYYAGGQKEDTSGQTSYGASYTANDVIGVALDLDNGTITFYKNNVSQGTAFSSLSGTFVPLINFSTSGVSRTITGVCNFGQRPFAYTPPAGFLSLCTTNLPTPTIGATTTTQANDYFNVVLYTGNGSTQSITGLDFQPDMVWIKGRSQSSNNVLQDAVRGSTKYLISNNTNAEGTDGSVTSFNSNGFTLTTDAGVSFNANGTTYVAWNWKANGAGSSNTAGSITSTVSVSTISGFSIVTYTGTGANATVGHGLGVAPKMFITKNRDSGTPGWAVYHASVGNTGALALNATTAVDTNSVYFNNTTPTSTVFSVGTGTAVNTNTQKYVAYCFAEVAGYSAFGSYTGNGSADGPFVFCGFRPRYVMWKRTDTTGAWIILDSARETYNPEGDYLLANAADAESPADLMDFTSNGFKIRNSTAGINANTGTYIYAAFAESPFKFSNAR